MTALDSWLKQATRCLSKDSAAQVRAEIYEHYESARDAAVSQGETAEEADLQAVIALGNAKAANRQYRKVLLTSAEARVLHEGSREVRAICSRQWLKRTLEAAPAVMLLVSCALYLGGEVAAARMLLAGAVPICLFFSIPFLPIYTPVRARVYRVMKWMVLIGMFYLVFEPDTLKYSWLFATCLWIPFQNEWRRVSIRRKLPIEKWPRQLYL